MAAKRPTAAQIAAAQDAQLTEIRLELELDLARRRAMLVPPGWADVACEPKSHKKTPVSLRLDEDLVKWFRALGPDYTGRINRVLRLFMLNVVSGEITGQWTRAADGRLRPADEA